jgi:hypothetical protein
MFCALNARFRPLVKATRWLALPIGTSPVGSLDWSACGVVI